MTIGEPVVTRQPAVAVLLPILDGFLEAASVAQKWRTLESITETLERKVARAFRQQGQEFVRAFGSLQSLFEEAERYHIDEAIGPSDWYSIFDAVARSTLTLFLLPIQDAAQQSMELGATDLIADMGMDIAFNLRNPRAVAYLQDHGAALVTRINETTRTEIQRIVTQAVAEGWDYNRTAREISDRYTEFAVGKPQLHIDSRAHLVAVTEAGEAYESGTEIVAQDLADAGLRMEKSWLTVGDDRVSDGCRGNQAEGWIPLAQSFPSGHQRPLRFPGCRCTALYRRAKAST